MIPKTIRKFITRRLRYSGPGESLCSAIKYSPHLSLPIGIDIDIKPGDTIIDCGANVGNITSLFARTGATVYAFEPHPACFSILKRRFSLMRNVLCVNAGVMDRLCVLTLRTVDAHEQWDAIDVTIGASFVIDWNEKLDPSQQKLNVTTTMVECIDLDTFIRDLKKQIRILKLDIEGAEIAVLNRLLDSGVINQIDLIVAETHEMSIPSLREPTDALRRRIEAAGLNDKIRLDWF